MPRTALQWLYNSCLPYANYCFVRYSPYFVPTAGMGKELGSSKERFQKQKTKCLSLCSSVSGQCAKFRYFPEAYCITSEAYCIISLIFLPNNQFSPSLLAYTVVSLRRCFSKSGVHECGRGFAKLSGSCCPSLWTQNSEQCFYRGSFSERNECLRMPFTGIFNLQTNEYFRNRPKTSF